MAQLRFIFLIFFISISLSSFSQTIYPKVNGYVGIVHPIVSFSKDETITNFKNYYQVGFPTGINIWKSQKIGFSLEVVPFIKAENGSSKMNNFLFHPGVLVSLGNGYTFVGRLAFETAGRYGVTPVFNKTIKKNTSSSYYVAIPLPVRFGNDKPATFGLAFQLGFAF
ncbi:hypothetical protein [Pedobacter punctiformis]|uniref:DUF3996 domain-containing protein n=1 Tax=Pedobacter punctiformis TaxID=3004097 RepID=A0ABT4LAA1_9SPHI|nr:hypothetical protein [Pedobacter sp. HCMS5-2]MCZ4244781.1 hypothetical protein [Pedobacter sp. HCMS5-2]